MSNKLHEIEYRTYKLSPELREQVKARRQVLGQTLQDFIRNSVESELKVLVEVLNRELPNTTSKTARPARLPMTPELLEVLQQASDEAGIPAVRLLQVCMLRAATRKRRRKGG